MMINVENFLPHSFPFILIDKFEYSGIERKGEGWKTFSTSDFFLRDSNRNNFEVPSGFLIEVMAQLSAMIAQMSEQKDGNDNKHRRGFLVGISNFEYLIPLKIGETIHIEGEITHVFGLLMRSFCQINLSEKLIARAELSFRLEGE